MHIVPVRRQVRKMFTPAASAHCTVSSPTDHRAPRPSPWFKVPKLPWWWDPREKKFIPTNTAGSRFSFTGTATVKKIRTAPAGCAWPSFGRGPNGVAFISRASGQEVIVEFLEGDPDRPIITGRVYNNDNMPPYDLPANATQSGIKSRSSKGGSADNFNELRFEDKKGEELIHMHAEKDQFVTVENDRAETIGRDRSLEVGRDKSETVGRNKVIQVGKSHNETIGSSMNINVGSTLTEMVAINYAETVGGAMELTVGGALAITVGAAMAETVGGGKVESVGISKTENIGSNKSVSVGKNLTQTIDDNKTVKVGKDLSENVEGKHLESVKKDYMLQAKKILITAEDQIALKSGKSEIIMKKNGDIMIKGKKINVKGSGDVIIKGSKIKGN